MKQVLDDNILTLQTMGSSKYAAKLMDTIKRWERNRNTIGEVFDAWLLVQRKWQYLESIFLDSDDIWLQLPEEAKKFDRIHKTFHQTMITTQQNPNVLDSCCQEGRLAEFKGLTAEFDRIQKSLTDYLDMKRSAFPRFYLISDDELLSILGTSEPKAVQPHMLKLFANCREVESSRGGQIVGMYSKEGEHFNFHNPVRVEGSVEDRMNTVDEAIQDTLQRMSKSAVYYYGSQDRIPWVHQYIDMVAILGTQIWWTWQVEDAFRMVAQGDKTGMKSELKKESEMLNDLFVAQDVAFRDTNIPKFVAQDVPLFNGLLGDLFPGLDVPRAGYAVLKTGIEEHFEGLGSERTRWRADLEMQGSVKIF
jgi:dynein heavy chain